MNEQELKSLKATMPWREQVFQTPRGGLVQVIDRFGNEVPLFTLTRFVTLVTAKLAQEKETANG